MNDHFLPTPEDPLGQQRLDDVFNGRYTAKPPLSPFVAEILRRIAEKLSDPAKEKKC